MFRFVFLMILLVGAAIPGRSEGLLLEDLTWYEAEKALTPETVVVIPMGAAAKERGPHLKLKTDWAVAEYMKMRIKASADVVIAPTVPYAPIY